MLQAILANSYFFNDKLRWNLGWDNPNQAGAFIVSLLPILWMSQLVRPKYGTRTFKSLVILGEVCILFLLMKTYSRGAFIAAVLSWAYFCGILFSAGMVRDGWSLTFRMPVLSAIICFGTGFSGRLDPGYVALDASVLNRIDLWKGGIQMINVCPLRGWGKGESGPGYMNWFQDIDSDLKYAGMVNSYLHVGVERGLVILFAVIGALFAFLVLIALSSRFCRKSEIYANGEIVTTGLNKRSLIVVSGACASSLLGIAVANVFSTLWVFVNLWWVPMVTVPIAIILFYVSEVPMKRKLAKYSICGGYLISGLLCILVYILGDIFADGGSFDYDRSRKIVRIAQSAKPTRRVLLIPDNNVLGDVWGKEVRRFSDSELGSRIELIVPYAYEINDKNYDGSGIDLIICCGGNFQRGVDIQRKNFNSELVIVHPIGRPVGLIASNRITVVFPGIDVRREFMRWKVWTDENDVRLHISDNSGLDVRKQWPMILKYFNKEI